MVRRPRHATFWVTATAMATAIPQRTRAIVLKAGVLLQTLLFSRPRIALCVRVCISCVFHPVWQTNGLHGACILSFASVFMAACSGTCPSELAWVDIPSAATVAHALAECSNQGTCDRATGKCACFAGFEGDACQRCQCRVCVCCPFAARCIIRCLFCSIMSKRLLWAWQVCQYQANDF